MREKARWQECPNRAPQFAVLFGHEHGWQPPDVAVRDIRGPAPFDMVTAECGAIGRPGGGMVRKAEICTLGVGDMHLVGLSDLAPSPLVDRC